LKPNSEQYLLECNIDGFDSLQLLLPPLPPKLLNFLYFVLCWYSVQVVPVFLTCIQQYSKYWQHIVITLNIAAANTGITSVMPVFLNTPEYCCIISNHICTCHHLTSFCNTRTDNLAFPF